MQKKFIICIFFAACSYNFYGQSGSNPFWNDANVHPLYFKQTYIAEGSPYFNVEYKLAEIITLDGRIYNNIPIKINLLENHVLYLTEDGQEMVAILPVIKVKFAVFLNEDGFPGNAVLESFSGGLNVPKTPIYQVIDSGKISLLKKITLSYRDDKRYGESVITRIFQRMETYYALPIVSEMVKIEKGKAAMLEICKDKKEKVDAFIEKNNIQFRNANDYKRVIAYYNSL